MTGPFDLSGKVVLVTGGNAGIGLGMATALSDAGASVCCGVGQPTAMLRPWPASTVVPARSPAVRST